jgi:hypothetical protein
MSKPIKFILGSLVATVAIYFAGGYLLPSQVEMVVWRTVAAPHDRMSALVATPKSWRVWSVWSPLSRRVARDVFGGPEIGAGGSWLIAGTKGSLQMTLTSFEPAVRASYDLIIDPLPVPLRGAIDFYNRGRTTKVRWQLSGDVGDQLALRWLGLIAPALTKGYFQDAIGRLGELAVELEHEAKQDALAAEEAVLLGEPKPSEQR